MMTEPTVREPDQIRRDCARKLHAGSGQRPLSCAILRRSSWAKTGQRPDWSRWSSRRTTHSSVGAMASRGSRHSCAAADLIRNIRGVAQVAELDGDEIGFLVAKVAEIKRQR